MSGVGTVATSHDVTERLSWELQAPLNARQALYRKRARQDAVFRRAAGGRILRTLAPRRQKGENGDGDDGLRLFMVARLLCKKRFNTFMHEAHLLLEGQKVSAKAENYPNATGTTEKPAGLEYRR